MVDDIKSNNNSGYLYLKLFIFFVFLVLSFISGTYFHFGANISVSSPKSIDISYSDFIVLLLTFVTVILTILGIGIALLAIFGIGAVKKIAAKQAETTAKAELDFDSSPISKRIMKRVESIAYDGVKNIKSDEIEARGEFD